MALDANGWTVLAPTDGVSIVTYVSSSTGSDSNNGLTPETPKLTITAAMALTRNGQPDWICLKRGDIFALSADVRFDKVGLSEDQKFVWTSYGTGERPIVTGGKFWYGESVKSCVHLAFTDIHFYEPRNDPDSTSFVPNGVSRYGIQFLAVNSDDVLIENCKFSYCSTSLQIQGALLTPLNNFNVRRNIFYRGREFGAQLNWADNSTFEENIFDQNGWLNRTVQLHNLYSKESRNCTVKNNLLSRGGAMGLKHASDNIDLASDFTIENNCFWRCWLGLGHSAGPQYDALADFSHQRGVVYNNTFAKVGKNLPYNSSSTQAMGLNIGNLYDCRFEDNIFAHNDEILADGEIFKFANPIDELSENITAINNIVWNWLSVRYNQTGAYMIYQNSVTNFVQVNNLAEGVTYPDPTRNLETYSESIGLTADEDVFLDIACAMDRDTWDVRFTADAINTYIRAGFGLADDPEDPGTEDQDSENLNQEVATTSIEFAAIIAYKNGRIDTYTSIFSKDGTFTEFAEDIEKAIDRLKRDPSIKDFLTRIQITNSSLSQQSDVNGICWRFQAKDINGSSLAAWSGTRENFASTLSSNAIGYWDFLGTDEISSQLLNRLT